MTEIVNKKARFDYEVTETLEVGIVLLGTEIKSIRAGKANLRDSYAIIKGEELFLLNMHISSYEQGGIFNQSETRSRKLLAHHQEILKLKERTMQEGFTLIPLKLYFKRKCAKILIGLAKGKKTFDKREVIKKRDLDRELRKEFKGRF